MLHVAIYIGWCLAGLVLVIISHVYLFIRVHTPILRIMPSIPPQESRICGGIHSEVIALQPFVFSKMMSFLGVQLW